MRHRTGWQFTGEAAEEAEVEPPPSPSVVAPVEAPAAARFDEDSFAAVEDESSFAAGVEAVEAAPAVPAAEEDPLAGVREGLNSLADSLKEVVVGAVQPVANRLQAEAEVRQ